MERISLLDPMKVIDFSEAILRSQREDIYSIPFVDAFAYGIET